MKTYTTNASGVPIANESRIYADNGFGATCFPVPFACINGQISTYPLRENESLSLRLISEMEKQGHLVVQKSEIMQQKSNAVRDSGDIVLELAVPAGATEAETPAFLYAYIGLSANQIEAVSSYPMFDDLVTENARLAIGGDFGVATMDQIADLSKHHSLEVTRIGLDGENDNFVKEKVVYSGLQSDGDRMGDKTFRFKQNDIFTENTQDRQMRLGVNTEAGVVILDGMRYLKVKIAKDSPVSLTFYYNVIS